MDRATIDRWHELHVKQRASLKGGPLLTRDEKRELKTLSRGRPGADWFGIVLWGAVLTACAVVLVVALLALAEAYS